MTQLLTQTDPNFLGIPKANWHYQWLVLECLSDNGDVFRQRTAKQDISLRSFDDWTAYGESKIGKKIGFGKIEAATITGYEVRRAKYDRIPIIVQVHENAAQILKAHLLTRIPDHGSLTHEEREGINLAASLAGRVCDVVREMDIPQWSPRQFVNTTPVAGAKGGYAIPWGLIVDSSRKAADVDDWYESH